MDYIGKGGMFDQFEWKTGKTKMKVDLVKSNHWDMWKTWKGREENLKSKWRAEIKMKKRKVIKDKLEKIIGWERIMEENKC